jgi:hypothetical protein
MKFPGAKTNISREVLLRRKKRIKSNIWEKAGDHEKLHFSAIYGSARCTEKAHFAYGG